MLLMMMMMSSKQSLEVGGSGVLGNTTSTTTSSTTTSTTSGASSSASSRGKCQKRPCFNSFWKFSTKNKPTLALSGTRDDVKKSETRISSLTAPMGKILAKLRPRSDGASASSSSSVIFPFQCLPYLCKLRIFSFLETIDKGIASQVSSEWNALIRCPSMWSCVDLTTFTLHSTTTCFQRVHRCDRDCYKLYCERMNTFHRYLTSVGPALKRFQFAYDIGDGQDGWLEWIESLLNASQCRDLESAYLNWKETPAKPFLPDGDQWSSEDYNELMHRHRHRQRQFVKFLEFFACRAPNISKLVMPFDWSAKSVQVLMKLRCLETLVLEKYFVFQALDQSLLDTLVRSLPLLKQLVIEVWTPSGSGLLFYTIQSSTLRYVDISQSRGFFLREVDLPNVRVFKAGRHPWSGPLVIADSVRIPCIYEVLCEGAPNLQQINEHVLRMDWRERQYDELNLILKAMCSCRQHKKGWML